MTWTNFCSKILDPGCGGIDHRGPREQRREGHEEVCEEGGRGPRRRFERGTGKPPSLNGNDRLFVVLGSIVFCYCAAPFDSWGRVVLETVLSTTLGENTHTVPYKYNNRR